MLGFAEYRILDLIDSSDSDRSGYEINYWKLTPGQLIHLSPFCSIHSLQINWVLFARFIWLYRIKRDLLALGLRALPRAIEDGDNLILAVIAANMSTWPAPWKWTCREHRIHQQRERQTSLPSNILLLLHHALLHFQSQIYTYVPIKLVIATLVDEI